MNDVHTDAHSDAQTGPHAGHDRLADELRAVALLALDRLDPLLARVRDAVQEPGGACPVCAALAAARAERPELAGRLAEHASGLVAALREALAAGGPAAAPPAAPRRPRRVQHVPVEREATDQVGEARC